MNRWQLRNRIIKRLQKMRTELQQTIVDKEWWNENRADAPPFDLGWDRVMLKLTTEAVEAWESGDYDKANRLQERMNDCCSQSPI